MKWPACLLLLFLAGCSGGTPGPSISSTSSTQAPAPGSCEALLQALDVRACSDPSVLSLELAGCVNMRFVVGLSQVVYTLPPGYTNRQSATNPQQVQVSLLECQQLSRDNTSLGPVSLANVGVLIEPVDYGQGEMFIDEYLVENVASSPILADGLKGLGYPVVRGNATILDSGNTRTGRVIGDVNYTGVAVVTGQSGAHTGELEGDHFAGPRWYVTDRNCQYYSLTAPVEFTADKGAMAKAMPPAGPLMGSGSQAISCEITMSFGRSSRENS